MISNGKEKLISNFVNKLGDKRFIYDVFPQENVNCFRDLFGNIGKRRELCLKKYDASRYVFLDADLEILNKNYFELLHRYHQDADILLTKVKNGSSTLPKIAHLGGPFTCGNIDMANFTFNKRIAKGYPYPVDYDPVVGPANDWRFFSSFMHHSYKLLDMVSARVNGRDFYPRLSDAPKNA